MEQKKQEQSIEDLFGMSSQAATSNSQTPNAQQKEAEAGSDNIFDYSHGKTFVGVGDVHKNSLKALAESAVYFVGGAGLVIWGLKLLNDFHLIFGPLAIIVGIFLFWVGIEANKMKCPMCKRIKAMDDIASDDLFADTDVSRYNVLQGGVHKHDRVYVKATKTSYDMRQCSYCGHVSGAVVTHNLASYKKDVDKR